MKKLSILINSMTGGGAEHIVSILLAELVKIYEVHLSVIHPAIAYQIPSQVKLHYLDNASLSASDYSKIAKLPFLSYKYYQFCKKNKIDISLSLLNRANYINILSKLLGAKHRTVISERASTVEVYPTNSIRGKISRQLVKWFYPRADAVIAISKGIAIDLANIFKINSKKITTIYNPIDLNNLLMKLKAAPLTKSKDFTFIAIGRFYKQKNFSLLLQAFAKLNNSSAKIILLGDGPLRKELTTTVTELKIENQVLMPGFISNIFPYLKNADCFVISSDYEGFGNVIIEALGCGKAVIATDCKHGPSEILADKINPVVIHTDKFEFAKYGILVPVNNPNVLALAMSEMIVNESKRKSYELLGPKRAQQFNTPSIFSQYLNVLSGENFINEISGE